MLFQTDSKSLSFTDWVKAGILTFFRGNTPFPRNRTTWHTLVQAYELGQSTEDSRAQTWLAEKQKVYAQRTAFFESAGRNRVVQIETHSYDVNRQVYTRYKILAHQWRWLLDCCWLTVSNLI